MTPRIGRVVRSVPLVQWSGIVSRRSPKDPDHITFIKTSCELRIRIEEMSFSGHVVDIIGDGWFAATKKLDNIQAIGLRSAMGKKAFTHPSPSFLDSNPPISSLLLTSFCNVISFPIHVLQKYT